MRIPKNILQEQSGSALLVTLLVLVAVTILGILSINTSAVELNISRNEREIRESFYLAEGAAMVGIQRLVDAATEDLRRHNIPWHQSRVAVEAEGIDYRDIHDWPTQVKEDETLISSPLDPHSYATAVEWNVAPGSSLIQTQSRLYQNRVYGLCEKNGTDSLIEIGYHMRY